MVPFIWVSTQNLYHDVYPHYSYKNKITVKLIIVLFYSRFTNSLSNNNIPSKVATYFETNFP